MDWNDPAGQQHAEQLRRQQLEQEQEQIRRQQAADQQRRQQETERQHQLEQRRLRELEQERLLQLDEERRQLQEEEERQEGEEAERLKLTALLGVKKPQKPSQDEGEESDDEQEDDEPGDDLDMTGESSSVVVGSSSASTGGLGSGVWIVGLLLVAAMAWFGWRSFMPPSKSKPELASAPAATLADAELPLAAPLEQTLEPRPDVDDVASGPLAEPAPEVVAAAQVPEFLLEQSQQSPSVLLEPDAEPERDEVAELRLQVSQLQAQLEQERTTHDLEMGFQRNSFAMEIDLVRAELERKLERAQQELAQATEQPPVQQKAKQPVAPARKAVQAKPAKSAAPVRVPAAPVASKPKTVMPPQIEPVLLGVDWWDGRASVMVGTTQAGDARVRVLQPGDVLHGVRLVSADPSTGKAVFQVSTGARVTLRTQGGD